MINCRQNVEERMILSLQEETMMDFDYYDEYFNKYIKRNIVMTMLRKANFADWWKAIKVKEDQGEKLIQNLIFFQASKCS